MCIYILYICKYSYRYRSTISYKYFGEVFYLTKTSVIKMVIWEFKVFRKIDKRNRDECRHCRSSSGFSPTVCGGIRLL